MKQIVFSFIKQLLFWLIFFALCRLIFILYNFSLFKETKFIELLSTFYHAYKIDLSAALYIMVLPFLLLFIISLHYHRIIYLVNKYYILIILFVYSVITTGELGLFPEWKTKLSYKALIYLQHPSEVYSSVKTSTFILLLIILLLQVVICFWCYVKFFDIELKKQKTSKLYSFIFLIICAPLMFLGIRGGMGAIPISQSEVYFSKNDAVNVATVNSGWNLIQSITVNTENFGENRYASFTIDDCKKNIEILNKVEKDTTINILKTQRPNIVVIILESWSADLIKSLGGKDGITPNFEKLISKGLLFTNAYSSGLRSEHGLASIFSGFPSHPLSSITTQPNKASKLPSIIRKLNDEKYTTSFIFGGQLMYGNIKAYIYQNEFGNIIEEKDFQAILPRGKLGLHDEYVLARQISENNKNKKPFFSALFSLSTHPPYDQPMKKVISWGENENEYINSAYYTDYCLGKYFEAASKTKWFDNTLFILVADHSHNSYRNWAFHSPQYRKIPMLFYGNVILDKYIGTTYDKICSQNDIAKTLLCQLGISNKDFIWSRDLFNPHYKPYAYYAFDEGVGFVTPEGYLVYNKLNNKIIDHNFNDNQLLLEKSLTNAKSYLQLVFQQYLDY